MEINEKKLNGVVYTPKWIVGLILDQIGYKNSVSSKRIIDPACGAGAFLSEIVERFIIDAKNNKLNRQDIRKGLENNIFGFDIDSVAIKKCIKILDEIAQKFDFKNIKLQILKTDSLDKSFINKYFNTFDLDRK